MDPSDILGADTLMTFLDLAGIFVAALLGAHAATRERFDMIGVLALALACGLGGGIIRDVLISVGPPLALLRPSYLTTALVGALVVLVIDVEGTRIGSSMLRVGEALTIGFFTAAGAQRAALVGLDALPVGLLGVITAIGGGVFADMLLGHQPTVLRRGTLRATVAIVAAITYVSLAALGVADGWTVLACVVVGFVLRMAAIHWDLALPDEPQPLRPSRIVPRRRRER